MNTFVKKIENALNQDQLLKTLKLTAGILAVVVCLLLVAIGSISLGRGFGREESRQQLQREQADYTQWTARDRRFYEFGVQDGQKAEAQKQLAAEIAKIQAETDKQIARDQEDRDFARKLKKLKESGTVEDVRRAQEEYNAQLEDLQAKLNAQRAALRKMLEKARAQESSR
jgi:hypothetical protein